MINGLFIFALFVVGNVLLTNGFGAMDLQRNKNSIVFTLVNSFCVGVVIIVSAILYNLLYVKLLDPYNLEKLGILIIVAFAGLFNFLMLELIKIANKEMYYYYDTTYSFVINMGITVGILFVISPEMTILETLAYSGFTAIAYIITNMLFASVYKRLHNNKISRLVRPVPITIITMAVLAMIIYAISTIMI